MAASFIRFNASGPFSLAYVKSLVYANQAKALEELRVNIAGEIAVIIAEMYEQAIEDWVQRIDCRRRAHGDYMNNA